MLNVSEQALREGCERAQDLFHLNRLQGAEAAAGSFTAVFYALGIDEEMRTQLERALVDMVPVSGIPLVQANIALSMLSGVLVGLLIADSAMPADEIDVPLTSG